MSRDRPAPTDRLSVDGGAFLDVEAIDLLAACSGLVGDESRAKQALGLFLHVVDRFDHLHAARLAATAGVDLSLDHPNRAAELMRSLERFFDGKCWNSPRGRHLELPQHCFGLVLVDVHATSSKSRLSLMPRRGLPASSG